MALIGSVVNQGSLQGQIASYNGALSGVFANTGLVGGQVVGMRGLQGEKGDTGDTGATGNGIASISKTSTAGLVDTYTITYTSGSQSTFTVTNGKDGTDGQDGHTPVIAGSKSGDTSTITADGVTIATIKDGTNGTNGTNGQDGHSPVVTASKSGSTTTVYVDGSSIATIDDGTDGTNGQDGHTPSVTASKTGSVTTVYVDGSSIATINDGTNGINGTNGVDGVSPTATVTKVSDTATITITDKNGTTTASISDGDANVQSDWNQADTTADDYIKNKPTIPTVNNATLTIQKNGTNVNTFTANASSDVTANITVHDVPSGGSSGQVLTKDSNDDYDLSWTTPSGGSSYTATSPISIDANDDISHDDSGVTAGTYRADIGKGMATFPTITVDAKGHITSASKLGQYIYTVTDSYADSTIAFMSQSVWAMALRSYNSYPFSLNAGSTSATTTITTDSDSGYSCRTYFRVSDVQAFDSVTYEPVIVDWSTDKMLSQGSSITLTVSIAEAYTNNISYFPILTYAANM